MKKNFLTRKDAIILSAIEVIDELGLQGLSTKELAKKQDITEGALYKHFKSKDEIILAVIDYYAQYDSMIMQSIELKKMNAIDNIKFYIKSYASYFENYPAITSIVNSYEFFKNDQVAMTKIRSIKDTRFLFLVSLINKAIGDGRLSKETNSEEFAYIISGFFREVVYKWRMERYGFSLQEKIDSTLNMLISFFSA